MRFPFLRGFARSIRSMRKSRLLAVSLPGVRGADDTSERCHREALRTVSDSRQLTKGAGERLTVPKPCCHGASRSVFRAPSGGGGRDCGYHSPRPAARRINGGPALVDAGVGACPGIRAGAPR